VALAVAAFTGIGERWTILPLLFCSGQLRFRQGSTMLAPERRPLGRGDLGVDGVGLAGALARSLAGCATAPRANGGVVLLGLAGHPVAGAAEELGLTHPRRPRPARPAGRANPPIGVIAPNQRGAQARRERA
jgi:hypothetical protein